MPLSREIYVLCCGAVLGAFANLRVGGAAGEAGWELSAWQQFSSRVNLADSIVAAILAAASYVECAFVWSRAAEVLFSE